MGSALSKVKGFFGSDPDSESSTRANTKTNAQPIRAPVTRSNSLDSPRAQSAVREIDQSGGTKKQKMKARQVHALCRNALTLLHALQGVFQVSFNRLVKERVFFEESVSDDEGGRASPVSRPYKEKHPGSFRMSEGEAFR